MPCRRRCRPSTSAKPDKKAATSSAVDDQPKLTRKAHSANSAGTPMALSTWLGPTLPDEQAEPEEIEIPIKSRPIIAALALRPGTAKLETLPSRGASCPNIVTPGAIP